jgi:hypothetical protein
VFCDRSEFSVAVEKVRLLRFPHVQIPEILVRVHCHRIHPKLAEQKANAGELKHAHVGIAVDWKAPRALGVASYVRELVGGSIKGGRVAYVAARKILMAISPRFAAITLVMGFTCFFESEAELSWRAMSCPAAHRLECVYETMRRGPLWSHVEVMLLRDQGGGGVSQADRFENGGWDYFERCHVIRGVLPRSRHEQTADKMRKKEKKSTHQTPKSAAAIPPSKLRR